MAIANLKTGTVCVRTANIQLHMCAYCIYQRTHAHILMMEHNEVVYKGLFPYAVFQRLPTA